MGDNHQNLLGCMTVIPNVTKNSGYVSHFKFYYDKCLVKIEQDDS